MGEEEGVGVSLQAGQYVRMLMVGAALGWLLPVFSQPGRARRCQGLERRKTIITPSKQAMTKHGRRMGVVIAHQKRANHAQWIMELGPVIGGWRHDYAQVWSKRTYSTIDRTLLHPLRAWVPVRHPKQARQWATAQYGEREGNKRPFSSHHSRISLRLHSATPIKRHGKIHGNRSP